MAAEDIPFFCQLAEEVRFSGNQGHQSVDNEGWNQALDAFDNAGEEQTLSRLDSRPEDKGRRIWKHSLNIQEANLLLATICLTYLSFDEFSQQPLKVTLYPKWPQVRPEDWPEVRNDVEGYTTKNGFLDYAAKFWTLHFQLADVTQADMTVMAANICNTHQQRDLALTWFRVYTSTQPWPYPPNPKTLLIAAFCGLHSLTEYILGLSFVDIEDTDDEGRTALYWAHIRGNSK